MNIHLGNQLQEKSKTYIRALPFYRLLLCALAIGFLIGDILWSDSMVR